MKTLENKVEVSEKLVSKSNPKNTNENFIEKELKKRIIKGLFDFNYLNYLSYQKKVAIAYKMMKAIGLPIALINDDLHIIPTDALDEITVKKVLVNQIETEIRKSKHQENDLVQEIKSESVIIDENETQV